MSTKSALIIAVIAIGFFLLMTSIGGGSRSIRSFPKTYNEAYREYQNGNTAPLEGFYKWLEKNP